MSSFQSIDPTFALEIIIVVACGGVVGFERQVRGKPIGIRTSILICLSTYIFVRLGGTLYGTGVDPTRVLGQVVTGVGFLGAGVILAKGGSITGVTSAAVVWMLAAIGQHYSSRSSPRGCCVCSIDSLYPHWNAMAGVNVYAATERLGRT